MYEKLDAKLNLLLSRRDFFENQPDESRQDPPEDIVTVNVTQDMSANSTYLPTSKVNLTSKPDIISKNTRRRIFPSTYQGQAFPSYD